MMDTLTQVYDPYVILLSVGVAFIGSYITICLCEEYRLTQLPNPFPSPIFGKKGMIVAMAVSFGGIALWGMHFCGMQAMHLADVGGVKIEIRYSIWRVVVSLTAAVLLSLIGLYVCSFDKMFGKTKQEILEIFVNHASKMSMRDVKKITAARMIWIISTHSTVTLIGGGMIAGSGVCLMHYLGIWGMEFEHGKIQWNRDVVAASVLIAMMASVVAFWILFRLLSLYSHYESLRLLSAVFMTLAVCGSHYTSMCAAEFVYDPAIHSEGDPTGNGHDTSVIADDTVFILSFVLLILVSMEGRMQYHKLYVEYRKVTHTDSSRSGSRTASRHGSRHPSESGGSGLIRSAPSSPVRAAFASLGAKVTGFLVVSSTNKVGPDTVSVSTTTLTVAKNEGHCNTQQSPRTGHETRGAALVLDTTGADGPTMDV